MTNPQNERKCQLCNGTTKLRDLISDTLLECPNCMTPQNEKEFIEKLYIELSSNRFKPAEVFDAIFQSIQFGRTQEREDILAALTNFAGVLVHNSSREDTYFKIRNVITSRGEDKE